MLAMDNYIEDFDDHLFGPLDASEFLGVFPPSEIDIDWRALEPIFADPVASTEGATSHEESPSQTEDHMDIDEMDRPLFREEDLEWPMSEGGLLPESREHASPIEDFVYPYILVPPSVPNLETVSCLNLQVRQRPGNGLFEESSCVKFREDIKVGKMRQLLFEWPFPSQLSSLTVKLIQPENTNFMCPAEPSAFLLSPTQSQSDACGELSCDIDSRGTWETYLIPVTTSPDSRPYSILIEAFVTGRKDPFTFRIEHLVLSRDHKRESSSSAVTYYKNNRSMLSLHPQQGFVVIDEQFNR